MNKIIPFLEIISVVYLDFRLIDISYEDYGIIFQKQIKQINTMFQDDFILEVSQNKFIFHYKKKCELWEYFENILSFPQNNKIDWQLCKEKYPHKDWKTHITDIMNLIEWSASNSGGDQYESILKLKNKSPFLYYLFNSIYITFRWKKDLWTSLKYINQLILYSNHTSSFYLLRARNMFLFFYQKVIWIEAFNRLILTDKSKIVDSNVMKQIFIDIKKAKDLNRHNLIIDLFEGKILLQIGEKTWIKKLESLLWNMPAHVERDFIHIWISDFYILTEDFKTAYAVLSGLSMERNFVYYRKIIQSTIWMKDNKLLNSVIIEMLDQGYKCVFYEKKHKNNTNIKGVLNENSINIPFDNVTQKDIFCMKEIIWKNNDDNRGHIDIINIYFDNIRDNFYNYYIQNSEISIILTKNNDS